MSTLDEVKEILNTLRIAMSLLFGLMVIVTGSIVKRYDENEIDAIFWIAVVLVFVLMSALLFVIKKLAQKTKEIKDL